MLYIGIKIEDGSNVDIVLKHIISGALAWFEQQRNIPFLTTEKHERWVVKQNREKPLFFASNILKTTEVDTINEFKTAFEDYCEKVSEAPDKPCIIECPDVESSLYAVKRIAEKDIGRLATFIVSFNNRLSSSVKAALTHRDIRAENKHSRIIFALDRAGYLEDNFHYSLDSDFTFFMTDDIHQKDLYVDIKKYEEAINGDTKRIAHIFVRNSPVYDAAQAAGATAGEIGKSKINWRKNIEIADARGELEDPVNAMNMRNDMNLHASCEIFNRENMGVTFHQIADFFPFKD